MLTFLINTFFFIVSFQKTHCSTLNSTSHQRANLSFTPVTLASLDPPVPESALPVSSLSVSRLQPDEQPDPDIQPKRLPQPRLSSRKAVTRSLETPSAHHNITSRSEHKSASQWPQQINAERRRPLLHLRRLLIAQRSGGQPITIRETQQSKKRLKMRDMRRRLHLQVERKNLKGNLCSA